MEDFEIIIEEEDTYTVEAVEEEDSFEITAE